MPIVRILIEDFPLLKERGIDFIEPKTTITTSPVVEWKDCFWKKGNENFGQTVQMLTQCEIPFEIINNE